MQFNTPSTGMIEHAIKIALIAVLSTAFVDTGCNLVNSSPCIIYIKFSSFLKCVELE